MIDMSIATSVYDAWYHGCRQSGLSSWNLVIRSQSQIPNPKCTIFFWQHRYITNVTANAHKQQRDCVRTGTSIQSPVTPVSSVSGIIENWKTVCLGHLSIKYAMKTKHVLFQSIHYVQDTASEVSPIVLKYSHFEFYPLHNYAQYPTVTYPIVSQQWEMGVIRTHRCRQSDET